LDDIERERERKGEGVGERSARVEDIFRVKNQLLPTSMPAADCLHPFCSLP
jgi:hypothetical protein